MDWYIVYKHKPASGTLQEALNKRGIVHYIPLVITEKINEEGTAMVEVETYAIKNLVFLQTEQEITKLVGEIDGLRAPMMDCMTGLPAIVPDQEMQKFIAVMSQRNHEVKLLRDAYAKFSKHQKVRVKGGPFAGIEGRVVRILRDRKLVISLGNMAVAISGIDRSLFEPID